MTTIVAISEPVAVVTVQDENIRVDVGSEIIRMSVASSGPQGPPGIDFTITVSDTEPADPAVGDVWIDTTA